MKRTLSIFLALVLMLSCFALCFGTGAIDESKLPACRCAEHAFNPDCDHCCINCPNLNEKYLTYCMYDMYCQFDPDLVGYCIDSDGKLVKCDNCTGIYPCDCGHDCCHPCVGHTGLSTTGCTCCLDCPNLNTASLAKCKLDADNNLNRDMIGYCIDAQGNVVECDKCTGFADCNCGHDCCHTCKNHVKENCRCCVACLNLDPNVLRNLTRCVQDDRGNLDLNKFGYCMDSEGNIVECSECTGIWPCNCGHVCCNLYEDVNDGNSHDNSPVLNDDQQKNLTDIFQNILKRIKAFFDNFFDAVFDAFGGKKK